MIDRRDVTKLIDRALKHKGFTRTGLTWRTDSEEVLAVLGLQKSNYDQSWFLNVGFWIRELGEAQKTSIRQEHCHVQARAQELWSTRDPSPDQVLAESTSIADEERAAELERFIQLDLLPVVKRAATVASLRQLLTEYTGFRVRRVAQDLLGVSA